MKIINTNDKVPKVAIVSARTSFFSAGTLVGLAAR
jgi:hypothetical protein